MKPMGFLLGIAAFAAGVKLREPLRKATVVAVSQGMGVIGHVKLMAAGFKEGVEDIIADAQYENIRKSMDAPDEERDGYCGA